MNGAWFVGRFLVAGLATYGAMVGDVAAQTAARGGDWSFSIAPVATIHPDGHAGQPYLSPPLGGVVPGIVLGAQRSLTGDLALALELGSSLAVEDQQTGRFIFGLACNRAPGCFDTVESTQRDTILDLLVSYRTGLAEWKGGPAVAWSVTHQGDDVYFEPGHVNFGLSGGIDVVVPVSDRVSIVPTARYHYLFRGDEEMYAGLTRHVVRVGVALRLRS
jgi:hypothetical protein